MRNIKRKNEKNYAVNSSVIKKFHHHMIFIIIHNK